MGVDLAGMYGLSTDDHSACMVSEFCRNPLHPGPCAGPRKAKPPKMGAAGQPAQAAPARPASPQAMKQAQGMAGAWEATARATGLKPDVDRTHVQKSLAGNLDAKQPLHTGAEALAKAFLENKMPNAADLSPKQKKALLEILRQDIDESIKAGDGGLTPQMQKFRSAGSAELKSIADLIGGPEKKPTKKAAPKAKPKGADIIDVAMAGEPARGITAGSQAQEVRRPRSGWPVDLLVPGNQRERIDAYLERAEAGVSGDAALRTPPVPVQLASLGTSMDTSRFGVPEASVRRSVLEYTAGSGPINNHLRSGGGPSMDGNPQEAQIAHMDAAFARSELEEDVVVLRGFTDPARVFGDAWSPTGSMVGVEYTDPAYSSTTTNPAIAREFAEAGGNGSNAVVARVLVPRGTRAMAMGAASEYDDEDEVLLDRGMRYRIVADHGFQNGARHLDLEVVPA